MRGLGAAAVGATVALVLAAPAGAAARTPNLTSAGKFLTSPTQLVDGHYYEAFPGFADFGLTIDGALALAASGTNDIALKKIISFLDSNGKDSGGQTINGWTGVGTADVSGGALGKEALLAQVTGYDATSFGGHDVLKALDASVCTRSITDICAAPGNYRYATSVFAQSLAVIAQLRAHHAAQAAKPITYLESLQKAGAWPSVLPGTGADVDSTALAVMALDLVGDAKAKAAVSSGLKWLVGRQSALGGFPGVEANSTNSTGLAVQALSLAGSTYASRIASARAYLATRQNSDGGFDVSAGTGGSDVRASTQAVSGTVGTSFATLSHDVSHVAAPTPKPTTTAPSPATAPTSTAHTSTAPSTTARRTTAPTTAARRTTPVRTSSTRGTSSTPSSSTASSVRTTATSSWAPVAVIPKRASASAAAASSGDPLANTGAHTSALTEIGAVLLGIGGLLTVAGRRRRPVAHRRHR